MTSDERAEQLIDQLCRSSWGYSYTAGAPCADLWDDPDTKAKIIAAIDAAVAERETVPAAVGLKKLSPQPGDLLIFTALANATLVGFETLIADMMRILPPGVNVCLVPHGYDVKIRRNGEDLADEPVNVEAQCPTP
jgi:hypothetical protein